MTGSSAIMSMSVTAELAPPSLVGGLKPASARCNPGLKRGIGALAVDRSGRGGAPDPIDSTAMSLDFAARPALIVSVFDGTLDARSLEVRSETLDRTDDQHRTCKAWAVP